MNQYRPHRPPGMPDLVTLRTLDAHNHLLKVSACSFSPKRQAYICARVEPRIVIFLTNERIWQSNVEIFSPRSTLLSTLFFVDDSANFDLYFSVTCALISSKSPKHLRFLSTRQQSHPIYPYPHSMYHMVTLK